MSFLLFFQLSIMVKYLIVFFGLLFLSFSALSIYSQKEVFTFANTNLSLSLSKKTEIASEIVANQRSRVRDKYGSGQYGSSRDKGTRIHNGIDIIAIPGEKIFAPFDGEIIREAVPYSRDIYRGIVFKGSGEWAVHELKIFYVEGLQSGKVKKGQEIGTVQDLTIKYPTITNHIHLEIKAAGVKIDPFEIWQYSF